MRVLLLDLGGVVCRMDHAARLARLAALCDAGPERLDAAVWGSGLDGEFDRGAYTLAEIVGLFRREFGFRGGRAELEEAWAAGFVSDAGVLAMIDALRPGAGCSVLSDNGPVLLAAMPRLLPDVWRRFDHVVFSCDIGACKPDPRAFRYALSVLGCPAADVLFLDDRPANVAAARALGMSAEVFHDPAQAAGVIRAAGLSAEPGT
jgi:FMN phosphatase YigB (HAD superfamily)